MRIEFLGTGGYHPNERRHTAGLLLPEAGLAFDAGTSAFRLPSRLRTDELDLFLSHAHLDHIVGLTFFLVPIKTGRIRRMTVHAAPPVLAAVETHLFAPSVFPVGPPFAMEELPAGGCWSRGGFTVSWAPLASHAGGSMAYRVDRAGGPGAAQLSLAYVTDTCVDGSYTDFVRGVDLLIHECYFGDDKADFATHTGHSFATPVANLAREAGVGRLVLVHIDPQDETDDPVGLGGMRSIFANTDLAEDGMALDL